MYEERKNKVSLRNAILVVLLITLFVFILVWLFPTKRYLDNNTSYETYSNYLDSLENAAKDYFTSDRMPSKIGDSVKLTLGEMLEKKLVLNIGGNAKCDLKESYVEITRMNNEYQLKVVLNCENYKNHKMVTIGCNGSCAVEKANNSKNTNNNANNKPQQETKPEETKPQPQAAVKYTVTFNSNGGSAVSAQTITSGQKASKPADPTRTGYTFAGWTLNGKAYDFNTAVTGDITLVANWNINKYTVRFDANGGSAVSTQTVNYGAKATKPADPTKAGYTFAGWTLNGKAYDFNTVVTGNIKLVANWTINKYTVTFNSNGGSAVSTQTVNYGAKASKPADPTRSGYTFTGWTLNGKAYDFNTVVTGNITLTANWNEYYDEYKEYLYTKEITATRTVNEWSDWKPAYYTEKGGISVYTYVDKYSTTKEYRNIDYGWLTEEVCDNEEIREAIDYVSKTSTYKEEIVTSPAKVRTSTSTDWIPAGTTSSSTPLESDSTTQYSLIKVDFSKPCAKCAYEHTYNYNVSKAKININKEYYCEDGELDGTVCKKLVTSGSKDGVCPTGYTDTGSGCVKYGNVTRNICRTVSDRTSYIKFEYRELVPVEKETTYTDKRYSISKNNNYLISQGYTNTGNYRTCVTRGTVTSCN